MNETTPGGWSKARIEALSDGIFAIVMTLLVLELKMPALDRHASAHDVWAAIRAEAPAFFSYVMTFFLASLFWFWHHTAFHYLKRADGAVLALNLAFLFFVTLQPFSTALLGSFTLRQPVSLAFYFGNQLALGIMFNAFWLYARSQGMVADSGSRVPMRFTRSIIVHPLACLATLAVLPFSPTSCFNVFAMAQVIGVLFVTRVARRKNTAPATSAAVPPIS